MESGWWSPGPPDVGVKHFSHRKQASRSLQPQRVGSSLLRLVQFDAQHGGRCSYSLINRWRFEVVLAKRHHRVGAEAQGLLGLVDAMDGWRRRVVLGWRKTVGDGLLLAVPRP